MRNNILFTTLSLFLIGLVHGDGDLVKTWPQISLALNIQDENLKPVENVHIEAGDDATTNKEKFTWDEGITNANGKSILKFHALAGVGVYAQKEGYYPSIAPARNERPIDERFQFDAFIYRDDIPRAAQVDPPMKKEVKLAASITLREIKNPIPLYCKRVQMDIPVRDVWLGYDFEVGDWVKPYGKGSRSDMRVRSKPKLVDPNAEYSETLLPGVASLEVDFGQDGGLVRVTNANGWLGVSEMKMPHRAPEMGYEQLPTLKIEQTTHEDSSENGKAKGYFFRTRVEREGEKIISAHYGKLMGKINYRPVQLKEAWWGDKKKNLPAFGSLEFTYYFNPTANDRNLEYDVEKNLFKQSTQWLRQP